MARIFISYSHRNMQFKDQFVNWFKANHPDHIIRDDTHLKGGQDWWPKVLQEVATCDVFVYLVSNKSLKSNYCRQEFAQAVNQGKRILPILIHGNVDWKLAGEIAPLLRRIQWVDLSKGMGNVPAMLLLDRSLTYLLAGGEKPKEASGTFDVRDVNAGFANVGGKVIIKDDLIVNYTTPPDNDPEWYRDPAVIAPIVIGSLVTLIATLISLTPFFVDRAERASATRTAIAALNTAIPTTDAPLVVTTNIPTRSIEELLGETQTVDARTFAETQAAQDFQARVAAAATATAEAPTLQAQFEGTLIAAGTATRQYYLAQTPSATPIPPTLIPTNTAAPTLTPIPPTNTPVPPTATPDPLAIARTPVTRNADWTPVVQDFDGVAMVLVPAGCFEMGNDPEAQYWNDSAWITGVPTGGEQCVAPFWLDQYEVTNAQFAEFLNTVGNQTVEGVTYLDSGDSDVRIRQQGGQWVADSGYADHPAIELSWFGARDYCDWVSSELPTEAQWEYAARGPDELVYPWGNEFVADNVVYGGNSGGGTARIGSRPSGVSWVGAFDLSGNVWEWTATLYQNYPYSETDGRNNNDNRTDVRVLRGGSWFSLDGGVRSALRLRDYPTLSYDHFGFRCVRPLL
jgi:formylglycine-generating enzyme required for sulfatase activity